MCRIAVQRPSCCCSCCCRALSLLITYVKFDLQGDAPKGVGSVKL